MLDTSIQTKFFQNDNRISVGSLNQGKVKDSLPVGIYQIGATLAGFHLDLQKDVKLPDNVFGDFQEKADLILAYYNKTEKNVGVILEGHPGTGKTLFTRFFSEVCSMPVVVIPATFYREYLDNCHDFLRGLGNCCIILDELDKILYGQRSKETDPVLLALLDLLDGFTSSHNIFLFTSNKPVTENTLTNRLSRIMFKFTFVNVNHKLMDQILDAKLDTELSEFRKGFHLLDLYLDELNIDTVTSIVDFCNLMRISPQEAVNYLNLRPADNVYWSFSVVGTYRRFEISSSVLFGSSEVEEEFDFYTNGVSGTVYLKLDQKEIVATEQGKYTLRVPYVVEYDKSDDDDEARPKNNVEGVTSLKKVVRNSVFRTKAFTFDDF